MENRNPGQRSGNGTSPAYANGAGGAATMQEGAPMVVDRRTILVMISVLLGLLLAALDQTIVGPALPTIVRDLNGFQHYTWVITIYLLTSTITVPIFGKLSDMYGRKWFYIAGIVVFLIGSALSGLSGYVLPFFGLGGPDTAIYELIFFRGIQGVGAGIITANAFAIVADLIPPAERGKWQGLFGAVFGLASVIGPTVGGYLTDNYGWRYVFYVNIPIGIVALIVLVTTFPAGTTHTAKKVIDWFGAGALIFSLTPLLLALSLGGSRDWAWDSPQIIGMFVMAAIFAGIFLFIESRAKEPILPLDLFKNSIFTVSMIAVFLTGVGLFGAVIYIPLFIQAVQGDSATSSGNTLVPLTISMVVASIVAGQVMSRTGKYKLLGVLGMGVMTLGMFLLSTMAIDAPRIQTVAYMIITGLGMGVGFPLFTLAVQNAFPIQRVGVVTATLQFFRSVGSTVGVAILGTMVNNTTQAQFGPLFTQEMQAAHVPGTFVQQLLTGLGSNLNPQLLVGKAGLAQLNQILTQFIPAQFSSFIPTIRDAIVAAMRPALFDGIQLAFQIGTVLLAAGFVATLFLKEIPLRRSNQRPSMAMAEGGAEGVEVEGFEAEAEEAGRELAASDMSGIPLTPEEEPDLVRR